MKPPPIISFPKLLLCLISCVIPLGSGFCQTDLAQIEPTPLMKHEARWLVQALEQAHFSKVSIDKLEPEEFLASFLKKLDRQKLYFTQEDIDRFNKVYSPTLVTFSNKEIYFQALRSIMNTRSVQSSGWSGRFPGSLVLRSN